MDDKRSKIAVQIEKTLQYKEELQTKAYAKSLEELVEDLKIYQYELEFQNDELRRIQAELEKSRDEFQELFHGAPVGYIVLDEQSRILKCNKKFRNMIWAEDFCDKKRDFRKLIAKEHQDKFYKYWDNILKGQNNSYEEFRLILIDGTELFAGITASVIKREESTHVFFSLQDITQRILTARKLDTSEARYSSLITTMAQGLAVHEIILDKNNRPVDYTFIDINESFERITGLNRDEVIGRRVKEIMPETEDYWIEMYGKVVTTGQPVNFENYSTGLNRHFSVVVFKSGENQFTTIFNDISDRIMAEAEAKRKNQMLGLALNAAQTLIWEMDLKTGEILFEGTESFEALSGYPGEQIKETNVQLLTHFFHPEDFNTIVSIVRQIQKGTINQFTQKLRFKHKEGHYFWIEVQGSVSNKNELFEPVKMSGITFNIDDVFKREILIKKQNQELTKVNEDKSKFFSVLAHDLRSPLGNILGIADILQRNISSMPQSDIDFLLNRNLSLSQNTFKLLDNLLEWGKFSMGLMKPVKSNISFDNLLEDALADTAGQCQLKSISVEKQIAGNISLFADPVMLRSIIRNLIGNAIKFSNRGGKVILGASLTSDGQFRFSVRDFGIGISQEDQIELFSFNPKKGKAGTEGEPSSGLGLYLCKEFITFHQGHMFVNSEAGSGAMLGFVMPLNNNSPA